MNELETIPHNLAVKAPNYPLDYNYIMSDSTELTDYEKSISKLMSMLRLAYPNFYKGAGAKLGSNAVRLWAGVFADTPLPIVAEAVGQIIKTRTEGWPPSIGEVKQLADKIRREKSGVSVSRDDFERMKRMLDELKSMTDSDSE